MNSSKDQNSLELIVSLKKSWQPIWPVPLVLKCLQDKHLTCQSVALAILIRYEVSSVHCWLVTRPFYNILLTTSWTHTSVKLHIRSLF